MKKLRILAFAGALAITAVTLSGCVVKEWADRTGEKMPTYDKMYWGPRREPATVMKHGQPQNAAMPQMQEPYPQQPQPYPPQQYQQPYPQQYPVAPY